MCPVPSATPESLSPAPTAGIAFAGLVSPRPAIPADAPRTLRGDFVVVRADTLRLLLPLLDVGITARLDHTPLATGRPGVFRQHAATGAPPLMALSAQMDSLARYPGDRPVVTPIATPRGEIGFGWNEIAVLVDVQLRPQALPSALVAPNSPLKEFVEVDGQIVFCCDAERVAQLALVNKVRERPQADDIRRPPPEGV